MAGSKTGTANLVPGHQNNQYVSVKSLGKFHHSSFMVRDVVKTAGTLFLKGGKLSPKHRKSCLTHEEGEPWGGIIR